MRGKIKSQLGQILLIIVLISFLLLTLAFSLSQITIEETKITKLEEESKKAFAAAEAALEARLASESDIIDISSLSLGPEIISGQAVVDQTTSNVFITPLLRKDEQYTFYLSQYNTSTKLIDGPVFSGNFKIGVDDPQNFCSEDRTKLAVELTLINKDSNQIRRRLIDPCSIIDGSADEWNLDQFYSSPISAHLLILRVIAPMSSFPGARIKITNQFENWPLQGRNIVSSATTKAGVSKKIQLFQSYPQIPADFFVTRF